MKIFLGLLQSVESIGLVLASLITLVIIITGLATNPEKDALILNILTIVGTIAFVGIVLALIKRMKIIATKLNQIKFPNRKVAKMKIPNQIKIGFHQYLIFFKEFVSVAKGVEIILNISENEEGLEITIDSDENISIEKLNIWLSEYIAFIKYKNADFNLNIETNTTQREVDFLILKLKSEISNLENKLTMTRLENKYLKEETEFFKKLSFKFAEREPNFHNQVIHGGKQQFADNIENHEN